MSADATFDIARLFSGKLARQGGVDVPVEELAGKVVALYFSAHAAGQPFELVFVSSDSDDEGFEAYTKDMPWTWVKFEDDAARTHLQEEVFKVDGIPQLLVLSPSGALITDQGRAYIAKDKERAIAEWCEEHASKAPVPAASPQPPVKAAEAFSTEEDF